MNPDVSIAELVPHQGKMCLWQQLLEFDAQRVRLASTSHRDADNPLRSDGQLRAVHLCEYGAQAMAVHGGLLQQQGGEPRRGFLVALRNVALHVTRIDDLPEALVCTAELLISSEDSQQYQFRIESGHILLAEGRAAVMLQTQEAQ